MHSQLIANTPLFASIESTLQALAMMYYGASILHHYLQQETLFLMQVSIILHNN